MAGLPTRGSAGNRYLAGDHSRVVAKDLPTTPKRRRLLRPDHAPLGSCATLTPAIGIMRREPEARCK
jgi:hypothetical protein